MTEALVPAMSAAKLQKFRQWLEQHGAELLKPTNEWEVLRYRAGPDTHVVYRNSKGRTWKAVNGAGAAVKAFNSGGAWRAPIERKRSRPSLSTKMFLALVQRDTDECFYCGRSVPEDEATIEHLVPLSKGGPNHISNFALAHARCNQDAGNLSVVEKVHLRERMRAA